MIILQFLWSIVIIFLALCCDDPSNTREYVIDIVPYIYLIFLEFGSTIHFFIYTPKPTPL